jgi:Outer membrane protein
MHKLTKWLNNLTKVLWLVMLPSLTGNAQLHELTLQKAYDLARDNYPLIQQKALLDKSSFLTIQNIQTAYLPQVSVNGQATYQSDVTSVPVKIPGLSIPSLSKDQYKFVADVNQLIYDGGSIKMQKEIQQKSNMVDEQKVEVELYKLKDRINQLYLGIVLLGAQLEQTQLARENINIGLKTVNAQVQNGTAYRSSALVLEAQLLQYDQNEITINANKKQLLKVMELFIHQPLSDDVRLQAPVVGETPEADITRPEIRMYNLQDSLLLSQQSLVKTKNIPKVSLFGEGGYGKPGLNMLSNDFALYGIGGIKFSWNLGNFYTSKREKQIINVNQKINQVQRDVFLFNTGTQLTQQQTEIDKLKQLVTVDEKLIDVRKTITESSKAQLQNGVITSNDYLREVNNEDQTRQSLILHQIQLLQAKINYQNIKGNQ